MVSHRQREYSLWHLSGSWGRERRRKKEKKKENGCEICCADGAEMAIKGGKKKKRDGISRAIGEEKEEGITRQNSS